MPRDAAHPAATEAPSPGEVGVSSAGAADASMGTAAGGSMGPGGSNVDSSLGSGAGGRQRFRADELAIVMSHFEIGVLDAIQEYPRGSRKAPKLIISSDTGMYLLKRRAKGKDDSFKTAFCHGIQLHLAERQFPLPHLMGTKKDNNSMLQLGGQIYELFEYIKGTPYDQSLEATHDSGKILSLFHKLLSDYQPKYEPPAGSYHASRSVVQSLQAGPGTLQRTHPNADKDRIVRLVNFLARSYRDSAKAVNAIGLNDWPRQIVHSDWHPGNMLFRGPKVVAVIDYDAARLHQRVIDAANGALQFSILGGGEDPSQWPDYIDESRFKRFVRGYDSVPDSVLSEAELQTVPHLMIEALVAESIIPIAATGQFGRMSGIGFLEMVARKVKWLQDRTGDLVAAVA